MRICRSFMLLVAFLLAVPAGAEEVIRMGEMLNLQRAVEISRTRHPNVLAARRSVDASESRIGQARANYFPQIDATAGYSRVDPVSSGSNRDSAFGSFETSRSFDQYSGSITLRQLLFDFGKTGAQVGVQRMNAAAVSEDLMNVESQIVLNVKQAYYNVLRAQRSRDVAIETVKQFEQHLEQAKGFYEVGTKPKFDVTKAEVDLSNAKLNLIRAENALRLSRVSLNNAMGLPDAPEYEVEDNLAFRKHEITISEAVGRACENRHDLLALGRRTAAAEESVNLARKGYFPVLSGSASYNRAGQDFPLDDGWSAGVALNIPIFSGFLTKHQVAEAKANLEVAKANEEALRQTVILDVQQAYLNLIEAEERIANTELTVIQATENYEIASGRYAAGVGNPIEVTDAEVALANAKTGHIQALYDYKVAQATLERAMGLY